MKNTGFHALLLLLNCLAVCALSGSHTLQFHQTRNQNLQNCQLICEGQPPISLPPYFLQNCTSTATNSSKPGSSHTPTTTTISSSENSTENTQESSEGSPQNSTTRIGRQHKLRNAHFSSQIHKPSRKLKHSNRLQVRHRFRTETRVLKREVKSSLLKQNLNLKEKTLLDRCHVICPEGGEGGNAGSGNNEGSAAEGQDSEETDSGDDYVKGEDTPIEIIYVPPLQQESKKPSEIYQINNYEIFEPVPPFGFGYDPTFIEGKHKKINKRKQHKDGSKIARNNKIRHN